MVEKSKKLINEVGENLCEEGGKILKNKKQDSSFIKEMRIESTTINS